MSHLGSAPGDQILQPYRAIREFPDRPVVRWRDANRVFLPDHLRNHRWGHPEMRGKGCGAPLLGIEPFPELHHGIDLNAPKVPCQGFPKGETLNIDLAVKDYRRARFIELLAVRFKGSRAALMKETGLTNGRLTQLLDPDEPFGDTAARRLVEKLHLPPGYFDLPKGLGDAPSAAGLTVAMTYDRMSTGQQELFLKLLEASFGADPRGRPEELGHSDHMDLDLDLNIPADAKKAHHRR